MVEPFSIEKHSRGKYTVLSLGGAFASMGYAQLRAALKDALGAGNETERYLVIDISNTTLLTSACLEAIYIAKKEGEANRWNCVIVAPTTEMQELFAVTGFDKFLEIYKNMENFLTGKGLS